MQFRVVVPDNVKPGQLIRIRCPDGAEGEVKVPKGLKSGDGFIFEMPPSLPSSGFLDREIVNVQDFCMALGVGLLIGLSIVAGFLLGVLTVTDPAYQSSPNLKVIKQPGGTNNNMQANQMKVPQGEL